MLTRWKLNSIRFAPRFLALIAILIIAAPLTFYLCYALLGLFNVRAGFLLLAIFISIAAGCGLLVLFLFLVAVEFAQDRWLDDQHRRLRNRKLPVSEGYYECQYCGCRNVRAFDQQCPACGKDLVG